MYDLCRVGIQHEECQDGWAVYSECEGDAPTFRAFFPSQLDAEAFAAAEDPHAHHGEDEGPICFDACVVVAVMTPAGIYTSNDYSIDTHEALRARVAELSESE